MQSFPVLRRIGEICALVAMVAPATARAGGVEVTAAGARPLGRGGAVVSSADGLDALRYNPARLQVLERWALQADAQVHFTHVCFDRVDADGTTYPTVCNDAPPGAIPQLGATFPIGDRLGLGIGLLPPPGTPSLQFGDLEDGTIVVDGQRVPSPSRHANIYTDNTAFFITAGLGLDLSEKLRLGASFGWGIIMAESISFTAGVPGAGPTLDSRNALSAVDNFVPRVSFALDATPFRGFGISSVTTWTDDMEADAALFVSGQTDGGFTTRVNDVQVTQPFGWETTLGLRYARARWDIELDTMLQFHARTDRTVVDIPDDAELPIDVSIDGQPLAPLPDVRYVQRRWKNQLVLRLGGEGEVVEDRLWLRGGFSMETNGVEHGYESVENFLVPRTGLHLGATVDVHPRVGLSIAYTHIFQRTTTVAPEDARVEQPVAARPNDLADTQVYVNGGRYHGDVDVVAFSIVFRDAAPREVNP